MIVKKIAFGDKNEAFIESRITNGINVIYSDDNNRGKTLVIQGLMYSLGYDSIFPSSFKYKEKYFYSEIEINNELYKFLRKGNSIIVKFDDSIQIFNTITEFKHFFDKNIIPLPRIRKDDLSRIVDFSLFYEVFFIGQDNRNPSGLISRGQFNKSDFKNMIYSLKGFSSSNLNEKDINDKKETIKKLKLELKENKKKITILRANPEIAKVLSKSKDFESFKEKRKEIDDLNNMISKIKRSRQREENRKSKLQILLSELNSLNKNISIGGLKCADCGSDRIIYSNNEIKFDVSNSDVRNNIINSIQENISQKIDIIRDFSHEVNTYQDNLKKALAETPPNFQQLVIYQEQVDSDTTFDEKVFSLTKQIESLQEDLNSDVIYEDTIKDSRKDLDSKLTDEMAKLYKKIDPNGNLEFHDIFTKRDTTFSGSEEQEFYFSKVISLNNILDHQFPIIIDSFRDGEISTIKEDLMLDIYCTLNKQVILTSTLKTEEYSSKKYMANKKINAIDYSSHDDCKILKSSYAKEFNTLMMSFEGILL